MTDPIVVLETTQLSVEPGGQGRTLVTVRNLGTIVEGFRLDVLGEEVSEWAEVTPAEVQVYPEQEATAVVVFTPPAGNTTRSGTFPFAVRAQSVVDAETSSVAEGDLDIGQVFGLQTRITPTTSSGRWRGKHSLEITNWGNAPVRLNLVATDPDGRLAFLIGPDTLDLPLGVTGHAQLRVRTLKPFLRGAQVRLPFQVVAQPDAAATPTGPPASIPNPQRATLDGAFVQRSILSKLTVAVAAVAVIAVAGLVAFTVTRGSAVEQAGLGQGPLQKPTLSAASNDATSVQLLWEPQPNVENYEITQLTADGDINDAFTVDGALNVSEVKDLDPETQYCFQLTALRGDLKSQLSDQACATTAVAPAVTASSSPEASVSAEPTTASPGSPAVDPSSAVASSGADGPSTPGGAVVAPPDGPSGSTASTAASSAAGSSVTSPAAGAAAFGPNQFINVVFTFPASDAEARSRAEALSQQYIAQGVQASVLRTTDFPKLELIKGRAPVDSYLVYVGPFSSQREAQSRCPPKLVPGAVCQAVQPSPGG